MTDTNTVKLHDGEWHHTWDLKVDLSKYRTSGPATKALHKALRRLAEDFGQNPDDVMLVHPEDNDLVGHQYIEGWGVCWEGGPYEWAYALSNANGPWGYAEPGYSFNLHMVDDRRYA